MTTVVEAIDLFVATDLDGTLLRTDGTVSGRTRRSIARAREAGIVVVLVTARSPRTLRPLAQQVGVGDLAICCNGAIVYDLAAEAIVAHAPLASGVAQWIVTALRAAVPDVCFAVERGVRAGRDPRYAALYVGAGADDPPRSSPTRSRSAPATSPSCWCATPPCRCRTCCASRARSPAMSRS